MGGKDTRWVFDLLAASSCTVSRKVHNEVLLPLAFFWQPLTLLWGVARYSKCLWDKWNWTSHESCPLSGAKYKAVRDDRVPKAKRRRLAHVSSKLIANLSQSTPAAASFLDHFAPYVPSKQLASSVFCSVSFQFKWSQIRIGLFCSSAECIAEVCEDVEKCLRM